MSTATRAPARVVVVGAGLAGGRTCTALRSAGFDGEIILVGTERHEPYDRPPLSKAVLTSGIDPTLGLCLTDVGVELRLGVSATDLDLAARTIGTDDGVLRYDVLVLATGAAPIRLPGSGPQLTLRTLDDARRLRAGLLPGARVVLIGAGWIGAEVATAALAAGCEVTCLEGAAAPLAGPLGEQVGSLFLPWWSDVDLRLGVRVDRIDPDAVILDEGERIPADLVVTGVGVRPQTDWLEKAGLLVDAGGVAVDAERRTSDPHVYAVGDLAARWSDRIDGRVHSGHWDEAANGPAVVAASIMGTSRSVDEVPYFWSDQFGRKIQYVGQHRRTDRVVIRRKADSDRWGAAWLDGDGRITAHLSVSFPKSMVQARAAIAQGRVVDADRCRDLAEPL